MLEDVTIHFCFKFNINILILHNNYYDRHQLKDFLAPRETTNLNAVFHRSLITSSDKNSQNNLNSVFFLNKIRTFYHILQNITFTTRVQR